MACSWDRWLPARRDESRKDTGGRPLLQSPDHAVSVCSTARLLPSPSHQKDDQERRNGQDRPPPPPDVLDLAAADPRGSGSLPGSPPRVPMRQGGGYAIRRRTSDR